jgi:hypothetical protein
MLLPLWVVFNNVDDFTYEMMCGYEFFPCFLGFLWEKTPKSISSMSEYWKWRSRTCGLDC